MSLATGIYDGTVQMMDKGVEDVKLLDSVRKALDYYKYFTYAVITFNAIAVISLFLRVFRITSRV
jgi:hypothetical protein